MTADKLPLLSPEREKELLDELARCYADAAIISLLEESGAHSTDVIAKMRKLGFAAYHEQELAEVRGRAEAARNSKGGNYRETVAAEEKIVTSWLFPKS